MTGPYTEIGRRVLLARKEHGMTRRQLAWWIRQSPTLEVTVTCAAIMLRELEDNGEVMNEAVLFRILDIVGLSLVDVADLLTQARAVSAASFAEDLRRAAKVIARDQQRPETEVLAGVTKLAGLNRYRPMV